MINELNHIITIQRKTIRPDVDGYKAESWEMLTQVYAGVLTQNSREYTTAQKIYAESTCVFVMRYKAGITAQDRILYNGRVFEILGPPTNINERNVRLHIVAKELMSGG